MSTHRVTARYRAVALPSSSPFAAASFTNGAELPLDFAARAGLEDASGGPVMTMSGVSHEGTTEVLRALRAQIREDRLRQKPQEEAKPWRP